MDVKDCFSDVELKSHIELHSENRRRCTMLAHRLKELAAKDESLKAKKPEEQYRRNAIDQNILTAIDSYNMFREDLQSETLTCRN